MSGREDRKRFYNAFCISSNSSNCCYLIQVSSPHPLLYSCKLPKGECALFYGGFLGFPLQSVGFPRGFPGVSVVSSTVATFLKPLVHNFCWAQQSGTPSCATSAQERIPSRRRRSVPLPYQQSLLRDPNNNMSRGFVFGT